MFSEVADQHAPVKRRRVKGTPLPWMNSQISDSMKERDWAHRKARKSNSARHWSMYAKLRNKVNGFSKNWKLARPVPNAWAQQYHQGRGSHEKALTLIRAHVLNGPFLPTQVQSNHLSASSTQHTWELLAGNCTAVFPRHALGRRISISADLCASKSSKTNWPGGELVYVCHLLLSLSCFSLNACSNVQEDLFIQHLLRRLKV